MALLRTREAVMTHFRPMLRSHGVTEQQWRVLRALMEHEELEVTQLAERSFILSPRLSRILQNLPVAWNRSTADSRLWTAVLNRSTKAVVSIR